MTIPLHLTETDRARLLIEATVADIERQSRELVECTTANGTHGYHGAALERDILRGQAIIGAQIAFLTGMPMVRLCAALGVGL